MAVIAKGVVGRDRRPSVVADLHRVLDPEDVVQQQLQSGPEVFQVVRVEQRIAGRVEVREDDERVHVNRGDLAGRAEGQHAVDRVERDPADHEEQHDDGQVLGGLHFLLLLGAQHSEHRAAAGAAARRCAVLGIHCYDISKLKKILKCISSKYVRIY